MEKPLHLDAKHPPPIPFACNCTLETDLVKSLNHHVGHVFVQHGGGYDDLIEGFVVPPQS